MKRTFKIAALALLATTAIFAVSCSGNANKKQADGATETAKTETKAPKGVKVSAIPKDKIIVMVGETDSEKQAILAEIPTELLKIVGEAKNVMILKSTFDGWKYLVHINAAKNAGAKANLEKQIEYYRSIGATVEKSTRLLTDYEVKFDNAESTDVSATESYMTLEFNVIKL